MKLYQRLAAEFAAMIRGDSLPSGEQLPSVRALCTSRGLSPATVLRAYGILEQEGLIQSRPRSGYYVAPRRAPTLAPRASTPYRRSIRVAVSDLVFDTLDASRDRDVVPLGSAFPSPLLFPWAKLARLLGTSARHLDPWNTVQSLPPGSLELRRQIARRYRKLGMNIGVEEIVITAGALEALNLALQAVTRPGDTIAIESPTFYGCLQAAQRLGLNVVEIPTHPEHGMNVDALAKAVAAYPIRACWVMPTLHNPTGASMPVSAKRALVQLLAEHEIPLIEDDAYAELQFAAPAQPPAKAFDTHGLVLHCGSFSKCLAPGYRLGWIAAGRFHAEVARQKIESSIATSLPIQEGIALMLHHGGYDSHLMRLRTALANQQSALLDALHRHFPHGYRVAQPTGGYFLWVECAPGVDSLEVHRLALASGITIAPGPMFSARRRFGRFMRLNCGHPWSPAMDRAVRRLGEILRGA